MRYYYIDNCIATDLHWLPIQLTPEILQDFRVVTARAITMYCAGMDCVLVTFDGEERLVAGADSRSLANTMHDSETSLHII